MADCKVKNGILLGRSVVLEVADECPDTKPTKWAMLMAGKSKGLNYNPNTVTSEADDQGAYVETFITNVDIGISFEGEVHIGDKSDEYGFFKLERYFNTEVIAGRQPSLWVRMEYGENTFVGYMNITALSWTGSANDFVSATIEMKVADSSTISVTEKTTEPEKAD